MTDVETVIRHVHKELGHHGVNHATVELYLGCGDRDTHLNEHAH